MPFYRICPHCRAYLDFGEKCDCEDKEKAAPVQEHQSGKAEIGLPTNISASMITKNQEEIKHENCINK